MSQQQWFPFTTSLQKKSTPYFRSPRIVAFRSRLQHDNLMAIKVAITTTTEPIILTKTFYTLLHITDALQITVVVVDHKIGSHVTKIEASRTVMEPESLGHPLGSGLS